MKIQSIERAIEILRHVSESPEGLKLKDLAERCKLNKTTVFNLAETLVMERMLHKTEDSIYHTGSLIEEMAQKSRGDNKQKKTAELFAELHELHPESSMYYTELGEAEIWGRMSIRSGREAKTEILQDTTLNPYLTVCGLLYFAYMPEERLCGLKMKNPFDYKGLEAWGSEKAFKDAIALSSSRGYSETPQLVDPLSWKVGIPVRKEDGRLMATITFGITRSLMPNQEKAFDDLRSYARKLASLYN